MNKSEMIIGFESAYMSYAFPGNLDNVALRKKIGYSEIKGVNSYSCGNCSKFKSGFCTKYGINVKKHACCSGWEPKLVDYKI